MPTSKPRRVRDPLHNLIEFDGGEFEQVLWRVIETRPFQRLRRIRQLGFSDLVYPGATHTRFSHSIGVFHTARQLMAIIERHLKDAVRPTQIHKALAASLVHDVGHGMFSHSFEGVGEKLNLKMANHEEVSNHLIRNSEISEVLKQLGSGFADDVADVIRGTGPSTLYHAVVSSQFDADRLDYMQRDRLMTGVQNGGIDFQWLIANLEVGKLPTGVDEQGLGEIETFVLGPKASHAAETYVLALFQLYPTVYFHKTTRAAEKVFATLMYRAISLARAGQAPKSGLPSNHPIVRFAENPDSIENVIALDDSVFWGALSLLAEADDPIVKDCALRLKNRKLPKSIDIRQKLVSKVAPERPVSVTQRDDQKRQLERMTVSIEERVAQWTEKRSSDAMPRILLDRATRDPYKTFQESKGPLNQIRIRGEDGQIRDVAECSPVVAAIEPFELFRAYIDEKDKDARLAIEQIVSEELGKSDG